MKKISNILFASGLMMVSLIVGGAQSGCNAKSEGGAESDGMSAAETGAEAQAVGAETSQSTETPVGDSAVATKKVVSNKLQWFEYVEGYNKAKAENKILLVDAYTDWCGWCKVMDRETYTNAEVIAALNQDFVCVKFNPEVEMTHSFGKYNLKSNELLYWLANGQPGDIPPVILCFIQPRTMKGLHRQDICPPISF